MSCRLVIFVDASTIGYLILNTDNLYLLSMKFFQYGLDDGIQQEDLIRELFFDDGLFAKEMKETLLVYNFPDSELVPETYFEESLTKAYTELTHGNLGKGVFLSEKVPWWDICNAYRIPADLHRLLQYKFPNAKIWHNHSLLLKSFKKYNLPEASQSLRAIFYKGNLLLSVWKKSQLQFLQSFSYTGADDVHWFILNCCQQLGINQRDANLQISGFIEKSSDFFQGLEKLFPKISYDEPAASIGNNALLKDYPLYYFSSFLKIGSCV